jgi:glutathione synthase/RimK-type ligase-like ATP-grasp enzyme
VSYGLVEQSDGSDLALYTTRLPPGYDDFDDVALAPVILQDEIAKRSDIRVTMVDTDVFAVSIESQGSPETTTDWRRPAASDLPMSSIMLPRSVEHACLNLLHALGLRFGAIDLVHSRDGEYYFLEINPTGQWGWLEVQLGLPISNSIAAALAKGG